MIYLKAPDWIREVRENIPVTKKWIFLNSASLTPLPKPVLNSIIKYHIKRFREPIINNLYSEILEKARERIAKFVNASIVEVALIPNISIGLSMIASGLPNYLGRKIVSVRYEFPAVTRPWLAQNYELIWARSPRTEDIKKVTEDNNASVIVLSHVNYLSGERADINLLSRFIHKKGGWIIVDAYHSAGVLPLNFKELDVDILLFGFAKWLMGPTGIATMIIKKEHIHEIKPKISGWHSSKDPWIFEPLDSSFVDNAKKFEPGSLNISSLIGIVGSLNFISRYSIKEISHRILQLSGLLSESLDKIGMRTITPPETDRRAGIISIEAKNPEKIIKELYRRQIIVSTRRQFIRVSTHFWNLESEIEVLLRRLTEYIN